MVRGRFLFSYLLEYLSIITMKVGRWSSQSRMVWESGCSGVTGTLPVFLFNFSFNPPVFVLFLLNFYVLARAILLKFRRSSRMILLQNIRMLVLYLYTPDV